MAKPNQLRPMREKAGITQRGMADQLGLKHSSLSYIENQGSDHHKYPLYTMAYTGVIVTLKEKK